LGGSLNVFEGIVIQTLSGLSMGMILFIVASGLILLFQHFEILNLAYWFIYMIGAYLTYQFAAKFLIIHWGFWIVYYSTLYMLHYLMFIGNRVVKKYLQKGVDYQFILTFT
jgi:branched-subunit amino acid ABC-type transport system permease component